MTLEERITCLERLLKNEECDCKFEASLSSVLNAVEHWLDEHFNEDSFDDEDELMDTLKVLAKGHDDITVSMCMDDLEDRFPDIHDLKQCVVNKLKKLAVQKKKDLKESADYDDNPFGTDYGWNNGNSWL